MAQRYIFIEEKKHGKYGRIKIEEKAPAIW